MRVNAVLGEKGPVRLSHWTSALIAIRRRPDRPERARNPKEEGGEQVYCSSHSSRKSKPEFGISVQFQLEENEEGDSSNVCVEDVHVNNDNRCTE